MAIFPGGGGRSKFLASVGGLPSDFPQCHILTIIKVSLTIQIDQPNPEGSQVQTPVRAQPGFGTQSHYKAPGGDLQVENVKTQ